MNTSYRPLNFPTNYELIVFFLISAVSSHLAGTSINYKGYFLSPTSTIISNSIYQDMDAKTSSRIFCLRGNLKLRGSQPISLTTIKNEKILKLVILLVAMYI